MNQRIRLLTLSILLVSATAFCQNRADNRSFGAVPDDEKDDTEALRAAVAWLRTTPGSTLRLEPGRYILRDSKAVALEDEYMSGIHGQDVQKTLFVPYHDYVRGLDFSGARNATVEAEGATLMVEGWMEPISIEETENFTLNGLTIDYLRKPMSEGRVIAIDEKTFTVFFDKPSRPLTYETPYCRVFLWDNEVDGIWKRGYYYSREKMVGKDSVMFRGSLPEKLMGARVSVPHTFHYRPAIFINESVNTVLDDVTIHSHCGMGIVGFHSKDITMNRLSVVPAKGYWFSTNTDATHFASCEGTITFDHCTFKAEGDDATNVHGYYHNIVSVDGRTATLDLQNSSYTHSQLADVPRPGDRMALVRIDNLEPVKDYKVISAEHHGKETAFTVTLDGRLPKDYGKYFLINATLMPKVVFQNCSDWGHPARGVLIKTTGGTIIQDNEFRGMNLAAITLSSESDWKEGWQTSNAIIRRNTIVNCGYGGGYHGAGIAVNAIAPELGDIRLHDNITIERNSITGTGDNQCGIFISNARDVRVADNFVTGCGKDIITESADVVRVLSKPGTLTAADSPSFDCYRSFHKQLDMTGTFARDLGINHRCFFAANTINSLGEYYCQYPPIWVGTGQYEWANLDAQVEDLVKASPGARLVCMIDLNTPYWAIRRYRADSYDFISHFACSGRWFDETMRWLDDFVEYAESKYGDRIDAYILSGGCTSEWYEYQRGYSTPLKDRAWHEWAAKKGKDYGNVVPAADRLHRASFENRVYDPETESDCIDYWKFHGEIIADAVLKYASHARSIIPSSKQIGAFFGYYFVSDNNPVSFGHMGYERVMPSKDIDFFIAPASYSSRAMGEAGGSQTMFSTGMMYGKRLLHEVDHRPHGYYMGGSSYNDSAEDIAGNLREACFAIINHADMWWFDMWSHFYDDPSLREAIGRAHGIFERFKDDNSASVSEILFLADPESMDNLNDETTFPREVGEFFRNRMGKTGMPMDCYSLSDVPKLDMSGYKVVALPATMCITPEKKTLLDEYVCRDGRTVIWCYAPGISDGSTLDPGRVSGWAGVPFGTEGISRTPMGDWTAVYAKEPSSYTSEALKKICLEAGVHEYVHGPDPVYANERLVCVHTKDGGPKEIKLPVKAREVVELFSGKTVAKRSSSFTYQFDTPDTRLFEIIH